jgi:hypothetical protein
MIPSSYTRATAFLSPLFPDVRTAYMAFNSLSHWLERCIGYRIDTGELRLSFSAV